MRVGILGSGGVGQALGRGFAGRGHEVMIASRTPDSGKLDDFRRAAGERAQTGTFDEAAEFGDVIALCTLWAGTEQALELAGADRLAGKVVIDVTNPLVFREDGPPALALGHSDSGGEQVQRWLPESRVVKAFNIVGNPYMVDPDFPGGPPDMWICGNDSDARETVTEICVDFGWSVIDLGGIEGARLMEPLCILWVREGIRTGKWDHAFKLLRK